MMLSLKTIKYMGFIGFFLILILMYATSWGIPGIRRYDSEFRLLDMRFRYSPEMVRSTLKTIGSAGRSAYCQYLLLDFVFIVCFFIVMNAITDAVIIVPQLKQALSFIILMRALFDGLENTILFILLKRYPDINTTAALICSWATSLKFTMLYVWMFFIITAVPIKMLRRNQ